MIAVILMQFPQLAGERAPLGPQRDRRQQGPMAGTCVESDRTAPTVRLTEKGAAERDRQLPLRWPWCLSRDVPPLIGRERLMRHGSPRVTCTREKRRQQADSTGFI